MTKILSTKALKKIVKRGALLSLLFAAMSGTAMADWRSDIGVFRIGISANYSEPFKPAQFELFRAEISRALNMPVEIFQARDASALIDAMASQRIEYAIMSALGYATLEEMCKCVTPLVAPISGEGATSVRSILSVNPKKIKTLDELSGKSIAIGPQTSLTSNLLPLNQFQVGTKKLTDIGATLVETSSTEEALKIFMAGDVDAFFGWQGFSAENDKSFTSLLDENLAQFPDTAVATLWRSSPIRYGPHLVRSNLSSEATSTLLRALLALPQKAPLAYDAIAPDLAGGLKAVQKSDYTSAFSLVRAMAKSGLDSADQTVVPSPQ